MTDPTADTTTRYLEVLALVEALLTGDDAATVLVPPGTEDRHSMLAATLDVAVPVAAAVRPWPSDRPAASALLAAHLADDTTAVHAALDGQRLGVILLDLLALLACLVDRAAADRDMTDVNMVAALRHNIIEKGQR